MSDDASIISTSWHSYPKVYALGQSIIADIFHDEVVVEEKIDGSQFSWGVFNGELKCRSKGAVLNLLAPEKMFIPAVETARSLQEAGLLIDGWTYRAEFLGRPKHNVLAYERIPAKHLIGFDVCTGHEWYLRYEDKKAEFTRLGLETVPLVFSGVVTNLEMFRAFLDTISILGGQKIEGVVVKNYKRYGPDGKAMMGKFVSEAFKEVHGATWKRDNPGFADYIAQLVEEYRTPARWAKAVQHLKERGEIIDAPQDIPRIMKEAGVDVHKECADEIREKLFAYAWPKIARGLQRGLPEWYKEQLLSHSFDIIGGRSG